MYVSVVLFSYFLRLILCIVIIFLQVLMYRIILHLNVILKIIRWYLYVCIYCNIILKPMCTV